MSANYGGIAFTDHVAALQERYGSRPFYARHDARAANGSPAADPLTRQARQFLAERDSFYLASVSDTGWPYVQYRGGPPGFLRVVDAHTVGWADFRGNLQYVSAGNISGDPRVALIVMDYTERRRLKLFGHARVAFAEEEPELVRSLAVEGYEAVVERGVIVTVDAFDWNCQQHITPRWSATELAPRLAVLNQRLATLEAENDELRRRVAEQDLRGAVDADLSPDGSSG